MWLISRTAAARCTRMTYECVGLDTAEMRSESWSMLRRRIRSANTLPDSLFLSAGVEAEIFVGHARTCCC